MTTAETLRKLFEGLPLPKCAELTPFEIVDGDESENRVRVEFAPQPAFGNHFGNIQGGFAVAMLEVPLTLAVYLATRRFLPTIEIKTSFLAPAKIGACVGEGKVLRAGSNLVFAEAQLWSADGALAAHATATSLATPRQP